MSTTSYIGFLESEQLLLPLLAAKKQHLATWHLAWDQVLSDDSPSTCQKFRLCEHAINRVVVDAKEVKTAEVRVIVIIVMVCMKLV